MLGAEHFIVERIQTRKHWGRELTLKTMCNARAWPRQCWKNVEEERCKRI